MKVAYIDAFSGVAGDMLLAALLDAGAPLEKLLAGLRTISSISGEWDIELHRVTRGTGSIAAAHVNVTSKYKHRPAAPPSADAHRTGDHDHTHGHSHSRSHAHGDSHSHGHGSHSRSHAHGDSHSHSHGHGHGQGLDDTTREAVSCDVGAENKFDSAVSQDTPTDSASTGQHNPMRNLSAISDMIQASELPAVVRERSIEVFTALGEAEAKTHDSTIDQVHFHEVGAIDSIIDTVGVVYALHLLGVEKVYCSALPYSEGTVWTAHGILPVPAPATLRLMMGLPTCPGPQSATGELVTPTGAALVRVLSSQFGRPPAFTPQEVGIGAGTKDFEKHPNILRVIVGRLSESPLATRLPPVDNIAFTATDSEGERSWIMRKLWMLETNIDDMTGEVAGYLTERLLAAGSLDAWISPAFMKKSRPAYCIHVLCEPQDQERIMRLLFEESSTLGVRRYSVERCSLRRETITTSTTYGDVRVKVGWLDGVPVNVKPEYEDCKVLAIAAGVPIQVVMDVSREAANVAVARLADGEVR